MSTPLLKLEDVCIHFGETEVVTDFNLEISAGERVALVGESGSGKTVTALSILRLVEHARISGSMRFRGEELLSKSDTDIRRIRGADIAVIFQEPMSALNPLYTIGNQIIETLLQHELLTPAEAREKAIRLLERTGIREPERRIDSYPHQLSGGQLQRAVIAMALACKPKLLIADEPTTALDMTIRARIVQLLLDLQEESFGHDGHGMAVLLITHDLNLVRRFAQRVAVMERGHLVETADTETLFAQPQHPYTVKLINSSPQRDIDAIDADAPQLLQTSNLRVLYPKKATSVRQWLRPDYFVALAGANINLRAGETVGIVGESGSGKSTLAQAILGLIKLHSGELVYNGAALAGNNQAQWRTLRAQLQVVFQDPFGSLAPRRTIGQIVGEGLELHFPDLPLYERHRRVVDVLAEVGLSENILESYPHQFSGGQRQRIAIARALVLQPRVLVLDEPTSALDVSIQNQVLQLLVRLQRKYGLSYILISHDLAVINALSHRVYVLKDGEIVEAGDTPQVIAQPQHPYTRQLVLASL